MLRYLLFALGFAVLIKGADWLADGASAIAKKFRVSNLLVGLAVVVFGTSAPELFVNIVAGAGPEADTPRYRNLILTRAAKKGRTVKHCPARCGVV